MVTLSFTLKKADFLIHQLYTVSQSPQVATKRKRVVWSIAMAYFILGLVLFALNQIPIGIGFLVAAVLWFLFYPSRQRKVYLRHLSQHVDEYYKSRFGERMEVTVDEDYLFFKNDFSESKVILSHLDGLDEIGAYLFLRLKSGPSLIIPKDQITDFETIKKAILTIIKPLNIPFKQDLKWEWN